ncbi:ABC transporter permease [Enterocloster citroniae]|uniref:ABC transporter permease n=1 Tax=Enterocloster citroniae TaxID=358743 RepID=UPI0008E698F7|nr:ABC transporter permease subunit [Enterocloster citroniae]SFS23612.1 putative aldouronate transport system permease protein [Enterocloster citroniae]
MKAKCLKAEQKLLGHKNKTAFKVKLKRFLPIYLMAVPGIIYLIINNYMPMLGIFIAFKKVNFSLGIFKSPWCGFKNFEYLFATKDAWVITRNTILYNLAFIALNLAVGVMLAIILNEIAGSRLRQVYQSFVLIPYLISIIIVGYLGYSLFSTKTGFLNTVILPFFGLDPVKWYSTPKVWPIILCVVNTWKNAGYYCIIYLAAVMSIDPVYYEAATIDGAGWWAKVFRITIPTILPVIITMTLLQVGRIFYSNFGLFYQVPMDQGMLYPTTNVVDTYVYRALINSGDISMSAAASVYQSIVGFVTVVLANLAIRRIDRESALF